MKKPVVNLLMILVFLCSCALILSSCASSSGVGGDESSSRAITGSTPSSSVAGGTTFSSAEADKAAQLRREIQAFESEMIFFDYDRAELKPAAISSLDKKAKWLRANPRFAVRISGHCDERGTADYNMALGHRRATAAYNYLQNLGVPSSQLLNPVSYGLEKPLAMGSNEAAWAKNRRAEFELIQR